MDKLKCSLLEKYQKYHLHNDNEKITKDLLEEDGRELLFSTSLKPIDRFNFLDIDFYRHILENIAGNFERNEDSIQKMQTGFNSLEKYAVNLWKFPWRKEYHKVKVRFLLKIWMKTPIPVGETSAI